MGREKMFSLKLKCKVHFK
ncbi:hypothetical protein CGLO_05731 [Colletotrichum gloeosporioides Cg-14]|uniref:Uncharacterized protein n=1 Tax=Colletotrichum gloeosporioides (strain Cg-14) TaxID=1237896 RepID=T0KPL5_COLGC|nr:hypothetical protein CGLO_05731 [Colletotrichum gloeosporioides Cg-14]